MLAVSTNAEFLAPLAFFGGSYSLESSLLLVYELGLRSADGTLALDAGHPFLAICLLILRLRDLVLPALAGMGRTGPASKDVKCQDSTVIKDPVNHGSRSQVAKVHTGVLRPEDNRGQRLRWSD